MFVLVLLLYICFVISGASEYVQNDDYCDDVSAGSDELLNAACSWYVPNLRFKCTAHNNETIPVSRVRDGICDCCSGKDELPGVCPDLCEQAIMDAKYKALEWHRHIQKGGLKRQDMINVMRRKKIRDSRSLESMRSDLKTIKKMALKMRYYQRFEHPKETRGHFKLLREREYHCISGKEEYCDYFMSGYHNDDEMTVRNAPDGFMENTRRLKRVALTQDERDYRASLSAVERVRLVQCNATDVVPDESLRIHTTLGEYLTFHESEAGGKARKKTFSQVRKESLFVRYLEADEGGQVQGVLFIGEIVSLLLSPVVIPLYGLHYGYQYFTDTVWSSITDCAYSLPFNTTTSVADTSNVAKENTRGTTSPGHGKYSSGLVTGCRLIVASTIPGTTLHHIGLFFDYQSYSAVMNVLDTYVFPYTATPYMLFRMLWYTPLMYVDYYVKGYHFKLPPTRNACLLRAGLVEAAFETDRLIKKINDESELQLALSKKDAAFLEYDDDGDGETLMTIETAEGDGEDKKDVFNLLGNLVSKRQRIVQNRELKKYLIDYGLSSEYEVLKDTCVSKYISVDNGSKKDDNDKFTMCFFRDVRYNNHILGRFDDWGKIPERPMTDIELKERKKKRIDEATKASRRSFIQDLSSRVAGIKPQDKHQAMLDEKRKTGGAEYFKYQSYMRGGTCSSDGNARKAVEVYMKCGVTTELESVHEYGDAAFDDITSADATGVKPGGDRASIVDACRYTMVVVTPMACTSNVEQESLDRLNELGVFGYTKRTDEDTMKKKQRMINEKIAASEQQKIERTREAEEAQKKLNKEAAAERRRLLKGEPKEDESKKKKKSKKAKKKIKIDVDRMEPEKKALDFDVVEAQADDAVAVEVDGSVSSSETIDLDLDDDEVDEEEEKEKEEEEGGEEPDYVIIGGMKRPNPKKKK